MASWGKKEEKITQEKGTRGIEKKKTYVGIQGGGKKGGGGVDTRMGGRGESKERRPVSIGVRKISETKLGTTRVGEGSRDFIGKKIGKQGFARGGEVRSRNMPGQRGKKKVLLSSCEDRDGKKKMMTTFKRRAARGGMRKESQDVERGRWWRKNVGAT